jgi:hypothetical protein
MLKGIWLWSDGSAWDYSHWGYNQPDNTTAEEDCLGLFMPDAKFHDNPCSIALPFVFKI